MFNCVNFAIYMHSKVHICVESEFVLVYIDSGTGTREWDPLVRSNDMLAERLLPPLPRFLVGLLPFRWALRLIPGLYGYVLARTRFIDEAVEASLADGQVNCVHECRSR